MIEPTTWVPNAALTIPLATAAADPLLEPPGVRVRSQGFRVPRGSVDANSVVTVLPTITAPASRKAETLAASLPERHPSNTGEPIWVGMSQVSIISLTPIGMPSINEAGRFCRQRAADWSAAFRARSKFVQTNAPTAGSCV